MELAKRRWLFDENGWCSGVVDGIVGAVGFLMGSMV